MIIQHSYYNATVSSRNYSKLYIIWNWMIRSLYGPFISTTLFGLLITILILYNQSIINIQNIMKSGDGHNSISMTTTSDIINSVNHIPIIILTMIAHNYRHYQQQQYTTHYTVTAATTNHKNNTITIIIPYHNDATTIKSSSATTTMKIIPTLFPNLINIISSLDHIRCILHIIPSSTTTSITKMINNDDYCYHYYKYYYYSADSSSKKGRTISSQQKSASSTSNDKDIRENISTISNNKRKEQQQQQQVTTISKIIIDDKFIEQRLEQLQQ